MNHAIFLIGWLGICINSRILVLILTSHAHASLLMPLLCVKFVIVLIMTALLIPTIFFYGGFTRLNSMIGTMNKQQANFSNIMQKYDLSHETDLRFSSTKLDVYLCDDGASFPPLESGLEAILGPPLITPSLVASASTTPGTTLCLS